MPFEWISNTQADEVVLNRLKKNFPKPEDPPAYAWFISGDVDHFDELLRISPQDIDMQTLERLLHEIQGGIVNFPKLVDDHKIWSDWYFHLLPHLLSKTDQDYLFGELITTFMIIFPEQIDEKYDGFHTDILHVLGQNLMFSQFWGDNDLSHKVQENEYHYQMSYYENDFVRTLSPAIFFCLKYLRENEVDGWVDSIAKINGPHWHYQLLNFLYKAIFLLSVFAEGVKDTTGSEYKLLHSNLNWWSNERMAITLPHENMVAFVQALKKNKIFYP